MLEIQPDETSKDLQLVVVLARGLTLLRFLANGETLGTTELARLSGLANATVSRLCYTLAKLNYMEYLPDLGKYRLGDACLSLGYLYMATDLLNHIARPLMAELAAYSQVPVCIARNQDAQMVYVARERINDHLSLHLEIGSTVPIERTAMGHAYLAALDVADREAMLARIATTVPDMDSVQHEIDKNIAHYENKGFCINDRIWMPHIRAVGVPLRMRDSGTVVAFNCGGIADYLDPQFLKEDLGPRLAELVRNVEKILETLSPQPESEIKF